MPAPLQTVYQIYLSGRRGTNLLLRLKLRGVRSPPLKRQTAAGLFSRCGELMLQRTATSLLIFCPREENFSSYSVITFSAASGSA